jgi:hypothetical protein
MIVQCVNFDVGNATCRACDRRDTGCAIYSDGTPCEVRTRRVEAPMAVDGADGCRGDLAGEGAAMADEVLRLRWEGVVLRKALDDALDALERIAKGAAETRLRARDQRDRVLNQQAGVKAVAPDRMRREIERFMQYRTGEVPKGVR